MSGRAHLAFAECCMHVQHTQSTEVQHVQDPRISRPASRSSFGLHGICLAVTRNSKECISLAKDGVDLLC